MKLLCAFFTCAYMSIIYAKTEVVSNSIINGENIKIIGKLLDGTKENSLSIHERFIYEVLDIQ